ncbi:MAG: hypothetical protein JWP89_1205 [Schlesneria sp.]|nr:hypothetical protein [Schlesneria sp.]
MIVERTRRYRRRNGPIASKEMEARTLGKRRRSGQHGAPYNRAATELQQLTKEKGLLPELRDQLLRMA